MLQSMLSFLDSHLLCQLLSPALPRHFLNHIPRLRGLIALSAGDILVNLTHRPTPDRVRYRLISPTILEREVRAMWLVTNVGYEVTRKSVPMPLSIIVSFGQLIDKSVWGRHRFRLITSSLRDFG